MKVMLMLGVKPRSVTGHHFIMAHHLLCLVALATLLFPGHVCFSNDHYEENDRIAAAERYKRSVRPTKSYEYKETDGAVQGMIVFQLDKKHPNEVYKIESPSRWVTVESTGAVKVKEPWDYEQLGKEKTIDFWVFVTGLNLHGKRRLANRYLLFHAF